jgi:hypothetical protein
MTASASYADPPIGDYDVNAGGFIGTIHFNPVGADGSVTGLWYEGSRTDAIDGWWDEGSQTIFFVRYIGGDPANFQVVRAYNFDLGGAGEFCFPQQGGNMLAGSVEIPLQASPQRNTLGWVARQCYTIFRSGAGRQ